MPDADEAQPGAVSALRAMYEEDPKRLEEVLVAMKTLLTREQIKAIRNADTAVFRWNHKSDAPEDADVLELVKEIERGDGFGRDELRVRIPAPARVSNYGGDRFSGDEDHWRLDPAVQGDWVLLTIRHNDVWNTFAGFVKAGDRLEQHWVVDNRNELLKQANLTHHQLKLRVIRPVKDSDNAKVHTFMLDAHVTNPHNLADFVRRERRS